MMKSTPMGISAVRLPRSPFFFEAPVSLGDVHVMPGSRMCAHSYMNGGRIGSGVYIGRYCSIGFDVTIGTGHHDYNLLSTSSWFERDIPGTVKEAEPDVRVRIKNDVWIGDKVLIMNGVTIGNGAVIGGGAVVTKDVADYEIVAGVPAKHLKWRFDDITIGRLKRIRWWEFDDEILRQHHLKNIHESLVWLESLPESVRTRKFQVVEKI